MDCLQNCSRWGDPPHANALFQCRNVVHIVSDVTFLTETTPGTVSVIAPAVITCYTLALLNEVTKIEDLLQHPDRYQAGVCSKVL